MREFYRFGFELLSEKKRSLENVERLFLLGRLCPSEVDRKIEEINKLFDRQIAAVDQQLKLKRQQRANAKDRKFNKDCIDAI